MKVEIPDEILDSIRDLGIYSEERTIEEIVAAILHDEVEAELTYRMYMDSRKGG